MSKTPNGFEQEAQRKRRGLVAEIFGWMMANNKWWLLAIILALFLLGALALLSHSPRGPWMYSFF